MANLKKYSISRTGALALVVAFVVPLVLALQLRSAGGSDWYRFVAWAACLIGCLGLLVVAGSEVRGRVWGAFIDERNRYSLSRMQMLLWAVLILSSFYVVFIFNVLRDAPAPLELKDLDLNVFALMGLSITSFIAAPAALSRKATQSASSNELEQSGKSLVQSQALTGLPTANGRILVKENSKDARFADLIRGEDVATATVIDVARTQMLLITAICMVVYGTSVGRSLLLGNAHLQQLPKLGEALLLLILVSHTGYIAGKFVPATTAISGPTADQLARAAVASQRASALVSEINDDLARMPAADARRSTIERQLSMARALAADAAKYACNTTSGEFTQDGVASMEGRVEAASAVYRAAASPACAIVDVPPPEIVSVVQRKLASLGYAVPPTGTPDADTERAIEAWLASIGGKRSDLHPQRVRYFEELAQLM